MTRLLFWRPSRGQERKAELYLFRDFGSRGPRDSAIAQVEAELPMRLADEIQYRHAIFSLVTPKSAPELLNKHERTLRRSQKEQRVDFREIDPLIEQVHGEERANAPRTQRRQSVLARVAVGSRGHGP